MTDHDFDIIARTLYGEARREYSRAGIGAFIAVANVIMNRFKKGSKYGKTIMEVCLRPFQFSCWNKNDSNRVLIQQDDLVKDPHFQICQETALKVAKGIWPDLTRESDHYHAVLCKPSWANTKKLDSI